MKNFFLPTPINNYRAYLLSNSALIIYVIILILTNILFGQTSITKTFALLDIGDIIELHNVERRQNDLSELTFNPILAESARLKGEAMLKNDCWSHYCPDGTSPWEFFKNVDYDYIFAGENLAEGFGDSEIVMNAWMNSKTHRENVLKPQFTEVGIAIVYGSFQGIKNNAIVVVHFGTPLPEEIKKEVSRSNTGQLNIISPNDGEISNNPRPEINGTAEENINEVQIIINDRNEGSVIPNGGEFSYNPELDFTEGLNQISVNAITENIIGETISESDNANYFLDITPPKVDSENLSVDYIVSNSDQEKDWIIKYSEKQPYEADRISISTEKDTYVAKSSESGITTIQIDGSEINETTELSIHDKAGNTTKVLLSSAEILRLQSEADKAEIIEIPSTEDESNNIFGIFADLFNPKAFNWVNFILILFVLFLVSLIIIELRTKYKRKDFEITEKTRSNKGLHLATLSILLILVLTGGLSGAI